MRRVGECIQSDRPPMRPFDWRRAAPARKFHVERNLQITLHYDRIRPSVGDGPRPILEGRTMAREAVATAAEVWRIAEEIAQAGAVPTVQAVRDRLGGGSFSTLSPLLKQWKEEREAAKAPPPVEIPAEVAEVMREATGRIWASADAVARQRIQSAEMSASERVAAAEAERDEIAEEVRRLERENVEIRDLYRQEADARHALELASAQHAGAMAALQSLMDSARSREAALSEELAELRRKVAEKKPQEPKRQREPKADKVS